MQTSFASLFTFVALATGVLATANPAPGYGYEKGCKDNSCNDYNNYGHKYGNNNNYYGCDKYGKNCANPTATVTKIYRTRSVSVGPTGTCNPKHGGCTTIIKPTAFVSVPQPTHHVFYPDYDNCPCNDKNKPCHPDCKPHYQAPPPPPYHCTEEPCDPNCKFVTTTATYKYPVETKYAQETCTYTLLHCDPKKEDCYTKYPCNQGKPTVHHEPTYHPQPTSKSEKTVIDIDVDVDVIDKTVYEQQAQPTYYGRHHNKGYADKSYQSPRYNEGTGEWEY